MVTALAAGMLLCGSAQPASAHPTSISVAVVPSDTTVSELARVGLSVGVMSTGIGEVPAEQTYLDISQGNRVDGVLYDRPLPPLRTFFARVPRWPEIVGRADSAPAEIVPGLLASSLLSRGVRSEAVPAAGPAALLAAQRNGDVGRVNFGELRVFSSGLGVVRKAAGRLQGGDLLIAFAVPSADGRTVPIGIAGRGFNGDLTSDSTRTSGYVLATDLAPTILRRFGAPVPSAIDGEPIRAEGSVDPAAVERRADRMAAIPDRRAPVLIVCLAVWIVIAIAVNRIVFGLRRVAIAWLALSFAYMPLMLLVGAWLEPGAVAEGLLVGFGAAALAALTVRMAWGWRGLAIACGATVAAYAADVIAGSQLTALSLLGPNPIYGARFYGIGNELEALIAVMVPAGVGAALTATGRAAAGPFLIAGTAGAIVFGAGRWGADVGEAIVLPIGAVVAALSLPWQRGPRQARRLILAAVATAFIALGCLALIDLVTGGDAHFSRSVLDAGGAGGAADAAQRRLELSAHDFVRAADNPLFWLLIAGVGLSTWQRRRIDAWLKPVPAVRAGFFAACAAVVAGTLVNDSGAAYLALGALAIGAFLAYAYAMRPAVHA